MSVQYAQTEGRRTLYREDGNIVSTNLAQETNYTILELGFERHWALCLRLL